MSSFDETYQQFVLEQDQTADIPGALFATELLALPDYWSIEEDVEKTNWLLSMTFNRLVEFVRDLASAGIDTTCEFRISYNPHNTPRFRLYYIVSVELVSLAPSLWRLFHTSFPSDLDFRLTMLPKESVKMLCNPFDHSNLAHYEWIPVPKTLALPNTNVEPFWNMPQIRQEGKINVLRAITQLTQPLLIGYVIKPLTTDGNADYYSMYNRWSKRLRAIDAFTALVNLPGGLQELVERYEDKVVQGISRELFDSTGDDWVWNLMRQEILHSPISDPANMPLLHILEQAHETALRVLNATSWYWWRVHAATINALPDHIISSVANDLRGSTTTKYECIQVNEKLEAIDNYLDIRLDWWQKLRRDSNNEFIPMAEWVDEFGATSLISPPILPLGGISGIRSYSANPFSTWQLIESIKHDKENQEIGIGEYIDCRATVIGNQYQTVKFNINDLTRHALITGSTGAGKSTTCQRILVELLKHGIPFLVIEPVKDEYADLMFSDEAMYSSYEMINFYRLGHKYNHLWFNPFYIRKGINLDTHLSYLQSAFLAAFPIYGIQGMVLKRVLRKAYALKAGKYLKSQSLRSSIDYGFSLNQEGEIKNSTYPIPLTLPDEAFPDLNDVIEASETVINDLKYSNDLTTELKAAIKFRMESLQEGIIGSLLHPPSSNKKQPSFEKQIAEILKTPTIIQLNLIADKSEKALTMAFMLMALYEHYEQQKTTNQLKHVTLVEEAHVLLENISRHQSEDTANTRAKAIELFVDMLAEVRSRGEGLIIAEQLPSKLISEAIKNTNFKIMHRLTARDDRDVLGNAMNFNHQQSRFATTLEQGHAIIFREGLTAPALVKITPVQKYSQERIDVTEHINRMKLNSKGHKIWPDKVITALNIYRKSETTENALLLKNEIIVWMKNRIKNPSVFGVLWFLRQMYEQNPVKLPYNKLRQHLLSLKK